MSPRNEPNNWNNAEDCTAANKSDGKWYDVTCTATKPFVCSRFINTKTPSQAPTKTPSKNPTKKPSKTPSRSPTNQGQTHAPTRQPSKSPTKSPTYERKKRKEKNLKRKHCFGRILNVICFVVV